MKEWLTAALSAESSSTRYHIENAMNNVTRFLPANPIALFAFGVKCQGYVPLLLQDNDTFECEDCHKMFKNEKNLRHHYKTHHELPHPKKTTAPGKPEPSAADKVQNIFLSGAQHISFLAQEFRMCMHIFIQLILLGKRQERQKGPSEVPLPHV